MRRSVVVASIAFAGFAGCVDILPPGGTPDGPGFAFEISIVDPGRDATEPSILLDPDRGAIFVSALSGLLPPRMGGGQSYLWKSTDAGATWRQISLGLADRHNRNAAPGGGDTDLALAPDGTIYYVDQWIGSQSVSVSTDGGESWDSFQPVTTVPVVDRPWIEVDDEGAVYEVVHTFAPGVWVSKSVDRGKSWLQQVKASDDAAAPSPLAIGRDGAVYFTVAAEGRLKLLASRDGGLTFQPSTIAEGLVLTDVLGLYTLTTLLSPVAIDDAGGLHVAFSVPSEGTHRVFYSHSRDSGRSWSVPVAVSPPTTIAIFPWIDAGASGSVALAWLAADARGTPDATNSTWDVRFAQSLDSGAHWEAAVLASGIHQGSVCTRGPSCRDSGADRSLGDFFELQLDDAGMAHVSFAATQGIEGAGARTFYAHQTAGPGAR